MAHEDTERIRSALAHLNPHDRDVWVRAALCIKSELGDAGYDIWDEWGSQYDKYSPSDARQVWRSVKENGRTGIGTLFFDAKAAGWTDDKKRKKPSAAEIAKRDAEAAIRREQADREDAERKSAAADRALAAWNAAADCTEHPYLARKGVPSNGLRVGPWEVVDPDTGEVRVVTKNALLIPIRDAAKKIHSLQAIFPAKSGNRDKDYLKYGAKSGLFYSFGRPQGTPPTILIGEGYATLASAHAATGHACIVAFDAGNLVAVARVLRERFPAAVLVLLADNDQWTEGNPGITKATEAAKAVGGLVAVPSFPAGADGRPKDFNDLHALQGLDAVREVIEAAAAPVEPQVADDVQPWEDGPEPEADPAQIAAPLPTAVDGDGDEIGPARNGHFTILGYNRSTTYVFVHGKQQIIEVENFGDKDLINLAPLSWWEANFAGERSKINSKAAAEFIIRTGESRGIFSDSCVRGRGAWIDDGRIVYHHGNQLTVDGERMGVSKIKSSYVYELGQSMHPPADEPMGSDEGDLMIDLIKRFRWNTEGSALLFAGWIALAPICGAIPWRPHLWVTGGAGSGKSSIVKLAHSMLKGSDEFIEGNSTESGIRQMLRSDAVPVIMDESESNEENDARRVQSILSLIRQASTESDARTIKGTADGTGVAYHIRSMFCLASIQVALKHKADIDRLSVLTLRSGKNDANAGEDWLSIKNALYDFTERDKTIRGRFLRRCIDGLKTTLVNIQIFSRIGAEIFKSQRHGDQYGTLLAGAWSLISTQEATNEQAREMFNSVSWEGYRERDDGDESTQALQHLMEAHIRMQGGVEVSVNELVCAAFGDPRENTAITQETANLLLQRNGMKVKGDRLLLSNNSTHLSSLMSNSPYAADIRGVLLRTPGADNYGNKPMKFSGVQSKCISLPIGPLVTGDEKPAAF